MPDDKKTIQPINAPFDDVAKAMLRTQTKPEEITSNTNRISVLAPKSTSKEITRVQGSLDLEVERDIDGIGMGVLSDGTPLIDPCPSRKGLLHHIPQGVSHRGRLGKVRVKAVIEDPIELDQIDVGAFGGWSARCIGGNLALADRKPIAGQRGLEVRNSALKANCRCCMPIAHHPSPTIFAGDRARMAWPGKSRISRTSASTRCNFHHCDVSCS